MCLVVLAWNAHPRYRLVVAANRDEFHDRPSAALGWWSDVPPILAGRDLRGGGTWMGVSRTGRVGVVTNYRDLEAAPSPGAPSRGGLVVQYLAGTTAPAEYVESLHAAAGRYAGFNLLVGDLQNLHYLSNRDGGPARPLEPGIHGVSNHLLDSPWPKLLRTREGFEELLTRDTLEPGRLFTLLGDRAPADDVELPDTGLPPDWERALSAPFVVHGQYGTRSSTLLFVDRAGHVELYERRFDAAGVLTGATRMAFALAGDDVDVAPEYSTTPARRPERHPE
jgi:uncharacterized protein with NRDE domain